MKKILLLLLLLLILLLLVLLLLIYSYGYNTKNKNPEFYKSDPDPPDPNRTKFTPCQMGCLQILQKNGTCSSDEINNFSLGTIPSQKCLFPYIACAMNECCSPNCPAPCPQPGPDSGNEEQEQALKVLNNLVYLLDEYPYMAFL